MKLNLGLPRNLGYLEDDFSSECWVAVRHTTILHKQSLSPNNVGSHPKYAVTYANPCCILREHVFTVDAK